MKIGTPKYHNSSRKNYFKIEDGENVYRILPPIGDLADDGRWSMYYPVHYCFSGTDKYKKPFICVQEKDRNGMIIQECPVCAFVEKLRSKYEQAKRDGAPEGTLKVLTDRIKDMQADKKHYVNAITLDGKIGLLKFPHRAKQALENTIKKLNAKNVDPVGVTDGRFFVFSRSGMGRDTTYQVEIYSESAVMNGMEVKIEKKHELTDNIINRLQNEAFELDKIYISLPVNEVKLLMDSGGNPETVDAVFSKYRTSPKKTTQPTKAVTVSSVPDYEAEDDDTVTPTAAPITATAKLVAKSEEVKPEPVKAATKRADKKTEAVKEVQSDVDGVNIAGMSDEEFMAWAAQNS